MPSQGARPDPVFTLPIVPAFTLPRLSGQRQKARLLPILSGLYGESLTLRVSLKIMRTLLLGIIVLAATASCGGSAFQAVDTTSGGGSAGAGDGGSSGFDASSGGGGASAAGGATMEASAGQGGSGTHPDGSTGAGGGSSDASRVDSSSSDASRDGITQDGRSDASDAPADTEYDGMTPDGPSNTADAAGDAASDCTTLRSNVNSTAAAAQTCNANAAGQCQDLVQGVCCPLEVANASSEATKQYLVALAAWKNAGCAMVCTLACIAPQHTCSSPSMISGTCR